MISGREVDVKGDFNEGGAERLRFASAAIREYGRHSRPSTFATTRRFTPSIADIFHCTMLPDAASAPQVFSRSSSLVAQQLRHICVNVREWYAQLRADTRRVLFGCRHDIDTTEALPRVSMLGQAAPVISFDGFDAPLDEGMLSSRSYRESALFDWDEARLAAPPRPRRKIFSPWAFCQFLEICMRLHFAMHVTQEAAKYPSPPR